MGQLPNSTIEEVFYGPGTNFNYLVGQGVYTNGSPDLRKGRGSQPNPPCTTAVSNLIPVEAADPHEEFIGEKEFVYLLHLGNGADDSHQKDQDELNEGSMFSLPIFGGNLFQKREEMNLVQVVKEEVEEGGFIEGEDRIHFSLLKKMVCHLGIVSLCGMPEEALQNGLLHLLSSGHVQTPGQK